MHYCVANMLGPLPLTATQTLNHAMLPHGFPLAASGLVALATNPSPRSGPNIHRGHVTHAAITKAWALRSRSQKQPGGFSKRLSLEKTVFI